MTVQPTEGTRAERENAPAARSVFRVFFFVTILLSLAAAILQTVFFLYRYDEALMFYGHGQTPVVFYIVCAVIGLLLLLSFLILPAREAPESLAQPGRLINFASLFCGFFLASSILLYVIYYLSGINAELSALRLFMLAAALPAALYFLITALNAQPGKVPLLLCGCFVIVWGVLFLMNLYFDMSIPMASPARPLGYLSVFSILFYFLLELRFILGCAKPRLYLSVSLTAIFALSLSCIPQFILIAAGLRTSNDSIFHIAEACILFYILTRMISVVTGRAGTHPAEYAAPRPSKKNAGGEALPDHTQDGSADPSPEEKEN